MDQSLPEFIEIRWIGTEICATFHKSKKIEFTSPEHLRGKIVQSINEAVRLIDDEDQYYYSHAQWEVIEPKGWTVWRYERRVAALIQTQQIQAAHELQEAKVAAAAAAAHQFKKIEELSCPTSIETTNNIHNSVRVKDDNDDEKIELVDDPRVCNIWSSDYIAKWIFQKTGPELTLIDIKYFRRYNHGLCFEFFCVWDAKDVNGEYQQTWQKYIDLCKTPSYNNKIREQWDYEIERLKHFEDYGPDPVDAQIVLPPLTGDAYNPEKITDIATKKMKKEEQELKKGSASRKKRSPTGRSRKKLKADTDSDDAGSGESLSSSENGDDVHEDNDGYVGDQSDHNEVPLNISTDRIIFETSSVSPVPSYKEKWFKKRVVKKNK